MGIVGFMVLTIGDLTLNPDFFACFNAKARSYRHTPSQPGVDKMS